jgi:predicted  nucleic acid-binding Zn-ribbon protein
MEIKMNSRHSKNRASSFITDGESRSVSRLHKFTVIALILVNLFVMLPNFTPVLAQRVVTVTADQPNIWTLEQAHYLLAQMHRRNLDIKANPLRKLDANAINGINIDFLRTLLEAGATFNEADQFNNNLVKQDKTFNTERRRQLVRELDDLNKESVSLARIIARLKREKETAESDDEKAKIEAEIGEKTEVKAAIDQQIELKNKELNALSPSNGTITGTTGSGAFDEKKFPSGILGETFQTKIGEILENFQNPSLNASLQLDNFLQLQYEIISKQLTLLRDEVGPGERLIFLELPQSVNATFDKSDDMWAQSRWRIGGFSRCELEINNKPIACYKILDPANENRAQNRLSRTSLDIFESITNSGADVTDKESLTQSDILDPAGLVKEYNESGLEEFMQKLGSPRAALSPAETNAKQTYKDYWIELENAKNQVKSTEKNLADKCKENKINCNDPDEVKKIDVARKNVSDIEERIKNPSPILLNLILNILNNAINSPSQLNKNPELNKSTPSRRTSLLSQINGNGKTLKLLNRLWIEDLFSREIRRLREEDFPSKFVPLKNDKTIDGSNLTIDNRVVRTIEMIPRQSSFNVNNVKVRNTSGAFNFIASFLFGFGANLNFQRQRERFSQFVQQELYSSAFGKGAREFGWTFTSMPGTDSLLSGLRTTYAIVIVPQEATSIVLESTGCAFNRNARQPKTFDEAINADWLRDRKNSCSEPRNFVVTIPGGGFDSNNDFSVSGLSYEPVEKGKRIVVSIYGKNFPSQIGVMVDGVPLPSSIGLAQNFIRDDSDVGDVVREALKTEKVRGSFERVDSDQIVAAFELVDSEKPIPVITLISPGKAVDINRLRNLYINSERNKRLDKDEVAWMFGERPKFNSKVKDVQIFISQVDKDGKAAKLKALITGASLSTVTPIFVNGIETTPKSPRINSVIELEFDPPKDEKIHIVLVNNDETNKLEPITNPAKAKPAQPVATPTPTSDETKLTFEVESVQQFFLGENEKVPSHLLVTIKGKGLKAVTGSSIGDLFIESDERAKIKITNPQPIQTITLTDANNNLLVKRIVEMPAIP